MRPRTTTSPSGSSGPIDHRGLDRAADSRPRRTRRAASAFSRTRSRRAPSASARRRGHAVARPRRARLHRASSCGASSPTAPSASTASASCCASSRRPGGSSTTRRARNLREWDGLCARTPLRRASAASTRTRSASASAGRVPLRLMAYKRSFRYLRTHLLADRPADRPSSTHDRDAVYAALRAGRAYIAMDSLAPARGFRFGAEGRGRAGDGRRGAGGAVHAARARRRARRACGCCATATRSPAPTGATRARARRDEPGVYRVEAYLRAHGRERTWILSNPIYLR